MNAFRPIFTMFDFLSCIFSIISLAIIERTGIANKNTSAPQTHKKVL